MLFTRRDRGRECSDDAHRGQRETEMVGCPDLYRSQRVSEQAAQEEVNGKPNGI